MKRWQRDPVLMVPFDGDIYFRCCAVWSRVMSMPEKYGMAMTLGKPVCIFRPSHSIDICSEHCECSHVSDEHSFALERALSMRRCMCVCVCVWVGVGWGAWVCACVCLWVWVGGFVGACVCVLVGVGWGVGVRRCVRVRVCVCLCLCVSVCAEFNACN